MRHELILDIRFRETNIYICIKNLKNQIFPKFKIFGSHLFKKIKKKPMNICKTMRGRRGKDSIFKKPKIRHYEFVTPCDTGIHFYISIQTNQPMSVHKTFNSFLAFIGFLLNKKSMGGLDILKTCNQITGFFSTQLIGSAFCFQPAFRIVVYLLRVSI